MRLSYLLLVIAFAATPVSASETSKLLPAETELVLTLNVRQFLDDHKNSEQEFFDRAALFRSVRDSLGVDLLQDVDRITFGFTKGGESWAVIVEGRFKGEPRGTLVKLNDKTLAAASGKHWLDDIQAQAAGRKEGGLSPATRTLLDRSAKLHVALVINRMDGLLQDALTFLKEKAGAAQLAAWLEKYGTGISSASIGLSIGDEELKLQWGLGACKAETARELSALVNQSNVLASLALLALNNDLSKQLATILQRQRVEVKETTLLVHVQIPYEFIRQVADATRLTLHPFLEELNDRIFSIPIWGPGKPPPEALEVEAVRGLAYRDDPKADRYRHRLDLFVPKGKKDFPVIVLVHGGAWMLGDNRCCGLYSSVGQFLAGQGIGVVLPNYRLSPYVRHPDHVKDVARAVAWTRDHIAEYGGSPGRIFLLGHSAGGHLVSLLATDESYLKAEGMKCADLRGVMTFSGVYHLPPGNMDLLLGGSGSKAARVDQMLPMRGDGRFTDPHFPGIPLRLDLFGPVFGDDPKDRAVASPLTHIRPGLPPFLILNAENDLPSLPEMADEFHQALRRAGCDARLLKMEKRNHNSLMFSAIDSDDPAARAILEFVRRHDRNK